MTNLLEDDETFFELSFAIPHFSNFIENPRIGWFRKSEDMIFELLYLALVETGKSSESFIFRDKYYSLIGKWYFKDLIQSGVTYRISRLDQFLNQRHKPIFHPFVWHRIANGSMVESLPNKQYDIIDAGDFGDYIAEIR